jgi:hypothetical protein
MRKRMSEEPRFVSVDELPDNPLKMPPPYWRSGGASFHIEDALERLAELLHELIPIHVATDEKLDQFYEKYPDEKTSESDAAMEEFGEICDALWEIEHKIKMKCELAILMAAIHAEETINQFCVFNLPKEHVESLERLSPAEKLTAAASHLNQRAVRSTAAYAAVAALSAWRNAFAHGHCVDRPVKTLRHNHLISPKDYPGVPDSVSEAIKHVDAYNRLAKYLAAISQNPYTSSTSDPDNFNDLLREVRRFRFEGGPMVYSVSIVGKLPNKANSADAKGRAAD